MNDDFSSPIGVIGGSGFYEFVDDPVSVPVETPYGHPSEPVVTGMVEGRPVAFIPRHGRDHRYPPHRVPYRANLWALRSVGVRQVLAPCAVGSLRPELGPGSLVVPDQVVDRTWGRELTYYDTVRSCTSVSPTRTARTAGRRWSVSLQPKRGNRTTAARWS
jgi:5'-methylthioadenosine phosphorylase